MSKIKSEFKSYLPYYITCLIVYYVLPHTIFSFSNEREGFGFAIVNYMITMPLTCLITGIMFGMRHGFMLFFPIGTGLLFLFSKFLLMYMDSGFYIVSFVFSIISLIGCGIGTIFNKIHKRKEQA